jgi:hypothetical protein
MTTAPVALTLDIRSEDGSSTEIFQEEKDTVNGTLRLLATPRLFAQPLLVLASRHSVSAIPCRTIDMILASTSAPMLVRWPAGFLDLVEVPGHDSGAHAVDQDATGSDSAEPANITASHMHVYTLGSWVITLKVEAVEQSEVHDQRLLIAHLFDLPVLPFRLAAGGIGLLNPAKISHVTARPPAECGHVNKWPALAAVPDKKLPAEWLRWTPRFPRIGGNA